MKNTIPAVKLGMAESCCRGVFAGNGTGELQKIDAIMRKD